MVKRIRILPVNTTTFEVANEQGEVIKEVEFTFNNYALLTLSEEFGDINKLFRDMQTKPYDLTAILLYCGVKNNDTTFTLDDAKVLVAGGGAMVLSEVTSLVTESLLIQGGEDAKKKFTEEMTKIYPNFR